ncbi:MAG: hypothetical protein V4450_00965 [Bacteroidota bacterium]
MRKFIYKAFILISVSLVGITLMDIYANQILSDKISYKIDPAKKILILGHSHLQCGLNDSLIANSISLAQSSDAYFYIYYKFKKIIESNQGINTLILGYSNNVFAQYMDDWVYKGTYMGYKYPKYSQVIPIDDKMKLFLKNPATFIKASVDAIKTKNKLLFSRHDKIYDRLNWGGYQFMRQSEVATAIKKEGKGIIDSAGTFGNNVSEQNINYLRKIIAVAKEHKLNIILLRSPLHQRYKKNHEKNLEKLLLEETFKGVQFWDYADYLMKDEEFIDLSHLNYKGARKFSLMINELLHKQAEK